MSERPLHVRVAEALGAKVVRCPRYEGTFCHENAELFDHRHSIRDDPWQKCHAELPRYDTSWDATGPLIERFGISLWCERPGDWLAGFLNSVEWEGHWLDDAESGATPLLAACNLILALSEAGKLEAQ